MLQDRITGVPGVSPMNRTTHSMTIKAQTKPPNATQAGSSVLIHPGDDRILEATLRGNTVTATASSGCVDGNAQLISCAHVIQFTAGTSPAVTLDTLYGTTGLYSIWPSHRTDASGNIHIAFSLTGPDRFPQARVAGKGPADSTSLGNSVLLKLGETPVTIQSAGETRTRWGDYMGSGVDPVFPECVWHTVEYGRDYPASNNADWGTWIGLTSYSTSTCKWPSATFNAISSLPSSIALGQSFTLNLTANNSGDGAAGWGGISVSFPQLVATGTCQGGGYDGNEATVSTTSDTLSSLFYPKGCTINNAQGQLAASHLLAEASKINWGASQSQSVSLTVTPKVTGTFDLRVRLALCKDNPCGANAPNDLVSRDPQTHTQNVKDQQDFLVFPLSVNVTQPSNSAPNAVNDSATVDEGGTTTILDSGQASVLFNDSDPDQDPLTAVPMTAPIYGTVVLSGDGTFSYTHSGSETTSDNFVYKACDDASPSLCSNATVNIIVNSLNDFPNAANDSATVDKGGTVTVLDSGKTSLLDNDSDPENHTLTVTATPRIAPSNGNVTLSGDGTFSYTHDGGPSSGDSFQYEACDSGSPSKCDTATVVVTVGCTLPIS